MKETKQQGIINQKKTEIERAQEGDKPQTILDLIKAPAMQAQFARALPAVLTPERFTRIVLTAIRTTPKLCECDKDSFLAAAMQSAQLGLEPNTPLGQAYLIPFFNGKTQRFECQFQIGYKGLIDLAYRSGEIALIQAQTVCENDEFVYELGLDAKLVHKPGMNGNRGNAIAYYAIFRLKNGGVNFAVMSRDDVTEFAKKKSKAFDKGPWQTDFDAMAKKTVLKQVLRYAPIRTEALASAVEKDEKTLLIDKETGEVLAGGMEVEEDAPAPGEAGNVPEEGTSPAGKSPECAHNVVQPGSGVVIDKTVLLTI